MEIKEWIKEKLESVRAEKIDEYGQHVQYKQGFQDGAEMALEAVLEELEKQEKP